jgi:hypothetical protein
VCMLGESGGIVVPSTLSLVEMIPAYYQLVIGNGTLAIVRSPFELNHFFVFSGSHFRPFAIARAATSKSCRASADFGFFSLGSAHGRADCSLVFNRNLPYYLCFFEILNFRTKYSKWAAKSRSRVGSGTRKNTRFRRFSIEIVNASRRSDTANVHAPFDVYRVVVTFMS